MCSTLGDCGPGYADIEEFRGRGGNWFACRSRASEHGEASERNRLACEQWCEDRPDCEMCSAKRNCGPSYEAIEHFTGEGRNWHACRKKTYFDEASERNKQSCEEWCEARDNCVTCLTSCVGGAIGLSLRLEAEEGTGTRVQKTTTDELVMSIATKRLCAMSAY